MPPETLGILLISGTHERAHYAFVLAAGAAAIGRRVTVFATNEGCRALLRDWSSLGNAGRDAEVRARGVAGLLMAALDAEALVPQAEVTGVPSFLSEIGSGPIMTL